MAQVVGDNNLFITLQLAEIQCAHYLYIQGNYANAGFPSERPWIMFSYKRDSFENNATKNIVVNIFLIKIVGLNSLAINIVSNIPKQHRFGNLIFHQTVA